MLWRPCVRSSPFARRWTRVPAPPVAAALAPWRSYPTIGEEAEVGSSGCLSRGRGGVSWIPDNDISRDPTSGFCFWLLWNVCFRMNPPVVFKRRAESLVLKWDLPKIWVWPEGGTFWILSGEPDALVSCLWTSQASCKKLRPQWGWIWRIFQFLSLKRLSQLELSGSLHNLCI